MAADAYERIICLVIERASLERAYCNIVPTFRIVNAFALPAAILARRAVDCLGFDSDVNRVTRAATTTPLRGTAFAGTVGSDSSKTLTPLLFTSLHPLFLPTSASYVILRFTCGVSKFGFALLSPSSLAYVFSTSHLISPPFSDNLIACPLSSMLILHTSLCTAQSPF
jgi:hypothetical protein